MRNFTFKVVGTVLLLLFITACYNYVFDTSGVFNKDFSEPRVEPNQHIVKMQYILDNPAKYDAYCFGSSRVGNIDLQKINSGYSYYNMTYSEGLPAEWLDDIRIMIKNGVSVKQIMLGIDDFSFRADPRSHESQYLRIPYGKVGWKTYMVYLLKKPSNPFHDNASMSVFDIYDSGRPLHPQADEKIEADVAAHVEDSKFEKGSPYRGNRIRQTMAELKEIKDIADANNIQLIVFINPINLMTYRENNLEEFDEFKRELAAITDYYDFSGRNDITANNYYYYETSHYRPMVGDMIVRRMFEEPRNIDTGFGVWVTKDNVEEHIEKLNMEL